MNKKQVKRRDPWAYESLRIGVMYVLEDEGQMTRVQLSARLGVNPTGVIGVILRNLESSGYVTQSGWPRVYKFERALFPEMVKA